MNLIARLRRYIARHPVGCLGLGFLVFMLILMATRR